MKKTVLKVLLSVFFVVAGSNHFINPDFYFPLIPDYLPFPSFINYFSGIIEIILGIGLSVRSFQRNAAWGIVILLILFIPSHVYFIQIGSCVQDGLCVPEWVAWVRLLFIHPILIIWAWLFTK
jgi:uncharacterized membrane protein